MVVTPALISNGTFETGNLSPWQGWGVSIGNVAQQGQYGVTEAATSGSGVTDVAYQDVHGLTPGQTYTVTAFVKAAATTTQTVSLQMHDTQGNNVGTKTITPTTSFQAISLSYTANSTKAMRVHLWSNGGPVAIYWDNVTVSPLAQSLTSGSSFLPTYNANNQYSSLPGGTPFYDANGNLTNDHYHTYTWNAEGQNATMDSTVTMTYDALGRWVERTGIGAALQAVYAPDGTLLIEANGQTPANTYLPLPGGATAKYVGGTLNAYWHADWLGTGRVYSSPTQTLLGDYAYAPFGENYLGTTIPDTFFTGAGQNIQANDVRNFPARLLHTTQGRWLTPDPLGLGAADPTNPQSWNRYAYVQNNPLALVDPTGMYRMLPVQQDNPLGAGWGGIGVSGDSNNDCPLSLCGTLSEPGPAPFGNIPLPGVPPELGPLPAPWSPISGDQPCDFGPACNSFDGDTSPTNPVCAAITPPKGPINYAASAQANSKLGAIGWFKALVGGGGQDFKGNSAFGDIDNQRAAGNFNFGASAAAKGYSLYTTQALAGRGSTDHQSSSRSGVWDAWGSFYLQRWSRWGAASAELEHGPGVSTSSFFIGQSRRPSGPVRKPISDRWLYLVHRRMPSVIRGLLKWTGIVFGSVLIILVLLVVALIVYVPGKDKDHLIETSISPDGKSVAELHNVITPMWGGPDLVEIRLRRMDEKDSTVVYSEIFECGDFRSFRLVWEGPNSIVVQLGGCETRTFNGKPTISSARQIDRWDGIGIKFVRSTSVPKESSGTATMTP